ncbi:MAG: hypothetical protein CSB46_10230, partial [Micrococcales bacterium]
MTRSLGRTGSCFDNAVSESFRRILQEKGLVHTRPWQNIRVLVRESADWFTYYNTQRRHST